jgi:hypothetical protein
MMVPASADTMRRELNQTGAAAGDCGGMPSRLEWVAHLSQSGADLAAPPG